MSSSQDHDFSSTSADASLTTPTQASQLAKGDYILIQNHPCKIIAKNTSKPGKHGHAKISFEATDIFTTKKYTELCPAHHIVQVPTVVRKEYLVVDLTDEGFLSLFDQHNPEATKDDVRAPTMDSELGEKLRKVWEKVNEGEGELCVIVLAAMKQEIVDSVKEVERE
ncbi:MAG: hypothetical protein Q9171_002942 [Xanthocarpia ochracea]